MPENIDKTLALVFPGQGSQAVGMMRALADQFAVVAETFSEASRVLGYDLWKICREGPEQVLNSTVNTQPALLCAGTATWRVWQALGGAWPVAMCGHSLGEYTALVCAGVLDFSTAVALVRKRAGFMQAAVPEGEGAMAAILGLTGEQVTDICTSVSADQIVSAANYNAPGQVVIAGDSGAVERAMATCKRDGAKRVIKLPVSVPSHCPLMGSAAANLESALTQVTFRDAVVPIVQNADAQPRSAGADIKKALVRQLHGPVLWMDCIRQLTAMGANRLLECGPGSILSGLNKRIDRQLAVAAIGEPERLLGELQRHHETDN